MTFISAFLCYGFNDIAFIHSENREEPSGILSANAESDRVISYTAPASEVPSADYTVSVEGQSIFTYSSYEFLIGSNVSVTGRTVSPVSFCYFDISGVPVKVTITMINASLNRNSVSIVPKSHGINATVTKNEFTFVVNEPGKITILPGGEYLHPLHIFVNPHEINTPFPTDPNIIYYGPGHHFVKLIDIPSDKTLYIAGGAILEAEPLNAAELAADKRFGTHVVNGKTVQIGPFITSAQYNKNITIRGRGIIRLRKSLENNQRRRPIQLYGISHLDIEGIIIQESSAWNVELGGCSNVNIDNLKIVSFFNNSDGIVIAGTSDVVVENSFIQNSDDGFEVKATKPMSNVIFNKNIAWTSVGCSFGLSSETYYPISNVKFTNNTVLYSRASNSCRAPLSVHALNNYALTNINARVNDFLFENIVIEKLEGSANPPIKVMNNWDTWNMGPATVSGNPYQQISENQNFRPAPPMKNIVFRNIQVLSAQKDDVVIMGDDVVSTIDYVTFDNVVINNIKLSAGDFRLKTNSYTSNIILLDSIFTDLTLNDINTLEIKGLAMYPNPTHNFLQINSRNIIKDLSIFNLLGQKMTELINVNQYSINIKTTEFKPGIYFLCAVDKNKVRETLKFIKTE